MPTLQYHVVRDHILWMPAHPPHLRFAVMFISGLLDKFLREWTQVSDPSVESFPQLNLTSDDVRKPTTRKSVPSRMLS